MFKLHKYLLFGWLENLDTVRHLPVGNFRGVAVSVTPTVWLFAPVFFALGVLQNRGGSDELDGVFYLALVYLIGVAVTTLLHQFGHILGGKLVGSPMDELLLTATRGVNIYHGDQSLVPGHVHLGRALGGPLFNLAVAGILYALLPFVERGFVFDLLLVTASTNLFFGIGSFAPLPSIDGWVIWREVIAVLRSRIAPRAAE